MKTQAELVTREQVGYMCRNRSDSTARPLWRKTLLANIEREKRGELGSPEQKQLTEKVVPRRKLDDMVRDYQPESTEGKELQDRIERLKNFKKD